MADYSGEILDDPGHEEYPVISTGDTTAPVVALVSPADLSTITSGASIIVDATDETAMRETIIYAAIGLAWEVIFGGESAGFAPGYSTSSRAVIANGYRYTIKRDAGWNGSPSIHVLAIDQGGNEAT